MARTMRLAERLSSWLQCSTSSLAHSRALHAASGLRAVHEMNNQCNLPTGSEGLLLSLMETPGSGCSRFRVGLLDFPENLVGSMELMAVPKRKVTPSRKGKRNGPKFLRAVPVVAKCKVCGKVKLPHFYCCDGQVKG